MDKFSNAEILPMMACGCRANCMGKPAGYKGDPIPACVIHNCFTVAEIQPDLTKRVARCTYYGKTTRRSECNYKGDVKENGIWICRCEQPSGVLPFFKYKGPGSYSANTNCKHCSFHIKAHWPRWKWTIITTHDWYKMKDVVQRKDYCEHAEDEMSARLTLERFINNAKHSMSPETKVHKVTYEMFAGPYNSGRDHEFEAHGEYEFDEFYCGCHSWN